MCRQDSRGTDGWTEETGDEKNNLSCAEFRWEEMGFKSLTSIQPDMRTRECAGGPGGGSSATIWMTAAV